MLLSVIIPAYNEKACLEETLRNIQDKLAILMPNHKDWEVIVCNNNSTDNTAEIATACGAITIKEPINQISRARNTGASLAKGIWLLFIDADTKPGLPLMKEMSKMLAEPAVIGCGATLSITGGTKFNKLRLERINPIIRFGKLAAGSFLLCRNDAFRALNGFSKNLYALEEIDFVFRLKRYARKKHMHFNVIYKHPVETSGRKDALGLKSMLRLFFSNFMAIVLFLLHYILPSRINRKLGSGLLGYWYKKPGA